MSVRVSRTDFKKIYAAYLFQCGFLKSVQTIRHICLWFYLNCKYFFGSRFQKKER